MKEDSIEELKAKLSAAEQAVSIMRKRERDNERVFAVLVAVGLLSEDKLQQAREIVNDMAP